MKPCLIRRLFAFACARCLPLSPSLFFSSSSVVLPFSLLRKTSQKNPDQSMLRIGLTSISRRFSSTTASYPYKLHWTPTQQGSLALSFSPLPQAHAATTPRIVGWIKESSGQPQPTPTNFVGNPQFEDAMHQLLKDAIHEDEGWKSMAFNQKQGYLNINDQRVWTPYARVADPEDLLGAVLLKDGSIVPGSYQKTPTHRLVSSNGLVQLSEALHELLVQRLEKL